jgi:hypothetical protein
VRLQKSISSLSSGGVLPKFEHKRLVDEVKKIDSPPSDPEEFATWIQAGAHLKFLRRNALSEELVVYGSGEYSFIYAAVIPNKTLRTLREETLLHWDGSPYSSIASYVWGGGREGVWLERQSPSQGRGEVQGVTQLIFGRSFDGWTGTDRTYFEVNQEYTHVTGIHWRKEHGAYCRFDEKGDLEDVVSISFRPEQAGNVACVSFLRYPLEEYLAATNSSLIRRFDFTLVNRKGFTGWPKGEETIIRESDQFFYRQKVFSGVGAYTVGLQIIPLRRSRQEIFINMKGSRRDRGYVEFIAMDWRNRRITNISTDPAATTNYFEAESNSLPYEMSPAFFRPEVILKYKADKEKYTVGERDVTCRAAWTLQAFDVNEAGQVFAYIVYLRNIPYDEQIHWKSYNEPPKTGLSERAITNDFEGRFTTFRDPLRTVLAIVKTWHEEKVTWWTLRDAQLLERVSTPLTSSRDEWSDAFMDLSKLVVEGFVLSVIRDRLDRSGIAYEPKEQSIVLLERLINRETDEGNKQSLTALRTVQRIRTKVKGHSSGWEVEALVHKVIEEHENFTNHFKHVCTMLAVELELIARAFASDTSPDR